MARYAVAAYAIRVTPMGQNEKCINLSDLNGRGLDLSHLTHAFVKDIQKRPFKNEQFGHYLSVERVQAEGRCISFSAEYGRYGVEGNIKNVRTNRKTHKYGADESPVVSVRNMLVVPPNADAAIFLAERCGGRGAATAFLGHLIKSFNRRFANEHLVLRKEGIADKEAWNKFVEKARLTQIKAIRYTQGHDIADGVNGLQATNIGKLEYTVKPKRSSSLAKQLMSMIMDQSIKPETQILGLREGFEVDEIRLQLTDGDQQKEVIMGRDGFPTLVYPIKVAEGERPSDEVIYDFMADIAQQLAQGLLLELPSDWRTGSWGRKSKSVSFEAVRDEC
ncbi:hypothetical protein [Microbispora sp. NBC_01389]|uniref:hypothetical protein n=1 Tax=Microbispora sp. NBC_01389 TaxID=2903584 RepID=UPI00324E3A58